MVAENEGVRAKTARGLGWTLLGATGQSIMQIVVLGILARLVSPRGFGIVAAALVVWSLSTILAESGIGPSLVQRPEISDRHLRAGLTFQVVAGALLWGLMSAASKPIAGLFRIDALAEVLPVITSVLIIRGLTLGDWILQRKLQFRRLAAIDVASWFFGYAVVATFLAFRGYGVWAMVIGHVGHAAVRTTVLWIMEPHAARPLWDWAALRELFVFGGGYTLGWWANYLARQGDNFVVGRWLGAATLGLYTRAYNLMKLPTVFFGNALNQVLFPAMSAVQHNEGKLRRAYLDGVALVALVALPASALVALTSREVILIVLGGDWLSLRAAFDIMVFGMLFRTGYNVSDCLTKAAGAVYRRAWRQGVYASMVVLGALVGQAWGLPGVAIGLLVALMTNFLLMAELSLRLTRTGWGGFVGAHLPGAVLAGGVALAVWPISNVMRSLGGGPITVMLAASLGAALVAVAFARVSPFVAIARPVTHLFESLLEMSGRSKARQILAVVLGPRYQAPSPTPVEST